MGAALDGADQHGRSSPARARRTRSRSSRSARATRPAPTRTRASTGSRRAHGSYEALLEDPDVDAIYISLPNGPHVEWSIRALEAGKHVLCEKPLTRRVADAERAFDAADAAGRLLMEAFMWRHNPQTQMLAELVARRRDRPAAARAHVVLVSARGPR